MKYIINHSGGAYIKQLRWAGGDFTFKWKPFNKILPPDNFSLKMARFVNTICTKEYKGTKFKIHDYQSYGR